MLFLPYKGPYKTLLPSTSSFPKVNLSASLFIQKRTVLQTCHSLAAELTLVAHLLSKENGVAPNPYILRVTWKKGLKVTRFT